MANMKLQSKFGANRQKWPRYCSLCVSKTAAVRHLEFYRKLDSGPQSHSYGQCQQPAYQILRKYLYCWPRYGRKTKFKTAAAAILNFQRMLFGPQVSLVWPMCIRRAHLVHIGQEVTETHLFVIQELIRRYAGPCSSLKGLSRPCLMP